MNPKPLKVGDTEIRLIVTPFTVLPAEKNGGTAAQIEEQKQFIRDNIIGKDNETIFKNEKAVNLLKQVGGDIQINNFACNFEMNGVVNTNIVSEYEDSCTATTLTYAPTD